MGSTMKRIPSQVNVILTDCFDTIIMRKEHPLILLKRWAACVQRIYPSVDRERLYRERMAFQRTKWAEGEGEKLEAVCIYEHLFSSVGKDSGLTETDHARFIEDLHRLEIICESSSHYICKSAVNFLKQQKAQGKSVYGVSDFHLYADDLKYFFEGLGISDLFDGIFVSANEGVSKASGALYGRVLSQLGVSPKACVMLGDNKHSDRDQASANGIDPFFRPHPFRRAWFAFNYRRQSSRPFSINKKAPAQYGRALFHEYENYEEYAVLFWAFCGRLYQDVKQRGGKRIVFLAREGYFLRKCFERYQALCVPENERLRTGYFKCSRRAIYSVQDDKCRPEAYSKISLRNYLKAIGFVNEEIEKFSVPGLDIDNAVEEFPGDAYAEVLRMHREEIEARYSENIRAFQLYMKQNLGDDEPVILVDVGWTGRMQQGIEKLSGRQTIGYYLGIYGKPDDPYPIETKGLLFHWDGKGEKSPYFDILRANTQLYEQLLNAPHGSAQNYRIDTDGMAFAAEEWAPEEQAVYTSHIAEVQKRLLSCFEHMCVTSFSDVSSVHTTKQLAQIVLRSALIQSLERLTFLKELCKGFSGNFAQETKGLSFQPADVHINLLEMFVNPAKYVRYFAKIGLLLSKHFMWVRLPIGYLFYGYVSFIEFLRGRYHGRK